MRLVVLSGGLRGAGGFIWHHARIVRTGRIHVASAIACWKTCAVGYREKKKTPDKAARIHVAVEVAAALLLLLLLLLIFAVAASDP